MHTKDAAAAILEPYMDLLAEPFPAAWAKWERFCEDFPEVRRHLSKRARASMVYDWAAARAKTLFGDMSPDVILYDSYGFLLIGFHNALYMRLKKYRDGSLATCGIPTGQQQSFANQEPLVGFPDTTNLVLGYRLNPLHTEIGQLVITCSTGGRLHWSLDVPRPGEAEVVEPVRKPEGPSQPSIRSTEHREEREGTAT